MEREKPLSLEQRLYEIMLDGHNHTLRELSRATGYPESSVSRVLRGLRQSRGVRIVTNRVPTPGSQERWYRMFIRPELPHAPANPLTQATERNLSMDNNTSEKRRAKMVRTSLGEKVRVLDWLRAKKQYVEEHKMSVHEVVGLIKSELGIDINADGVKYLLKSAGVEVHFTIKQPQYARRTGTSRSQLSRERRMRAIEEQQKWLADKTIFLYQSLGLAVGTQADAMRQEFESLTIREDRS